MFDIVANRPVVVVHVQQSSQLLVEESTRQQQNMNIFTGSKHTTNIQKLNILEEDQTSINNNDTR